MLGTQLSSEPESCNDFAESFESDPVLRELVERARSGDKDAIGQILDRYRSYLRHIAAYRTSAPLRRRIGISDLVQETLVEAHRGIDKMLNSGESHLRACLREIIRCNIANAVRDHMHTSKRSVNREASFDEQTIPVESQTSPSMHLQRREQWEAFMKAIDALPNEESFAIQMRYLNDASVGEIATSLGRTRGAAASLLKRGLARLRLQLHLDDTP